MRASLVLGLELPPVPAADAANTGARPAGRRDEADGRPPERLDAGPDRLEPWCRIAEAGLAAGAATLWFTDGPAEGPPGSTGWCDPSTLAGRLATRWPLAHMGVVASLPGGRHPSVVAREVSTLDVLTGGRAAVQMRWQAPPPVDSVAACDHLADAAAVCAAMLRGGDPVYDGRVFRISGAINVPAPRQASGVPVLVAAPPEVSAGLVAAGRRRAPARVRARGMVALADAVVCGADPWALAAWRAVLDDQGSEEAAAPARADREGTGHRRSGGQVGARPALLCSVSTDPAGGMEPGHVAARARDAGAEGVILRVASGVAGPPPSDATLAVDSTEVARLADAGSDVYAVASEVYALWLDRAI